MKNLLAFMVAKRERVNLQERCCPCLLRSYASKSHDDVTPEFTSQVADEKYCLSSLL